jgi:hypothetical protein
LIILHLSLFALKVPLSDPMTPFASALLALATLHILCSVDISWALGMYYPEAKHRLYIVQGALEMGLIGLSAILCNLYAAILSADHPSAPMLLFFALLLLLSVLLFGNEYSRPPLAVPSPVIPVPTPHPNVGMRARPHFNRAPLLSTRLDLRGFLARPRAPTHEGKNK